VKFSIFAVDGAARVESGASWIGRDKVILLDGRKTDGDGRYHGGFNGLDAGNDGEIEKNGNGWKHGGTAR
jgi:hypothetical protein